MTKIENRESVYRIVMKPSACVKCRIGQDWYMCKFEVLFIPYESYPDYIEVQEFVMNEIDGKELNIEEAARLLFDYLLKYKPMGLSVTNHIRDCKTHFDVDVTIE